MSIGKPWVNRLFGSTGCLDSWLDMVDRLVDRPAPQREIVPVYPGFFMAALGPRSGSHQPQEAIVRGSHRPGNQPRFVDPMPESPRLQTGEDVNRYDTKCNSGCKAGLTGRVRVPIAPLASIARITPMNIFGIGPAELFLIGIVALLVFGPKKLPEIGRSLGKTLKSFQEASREFESEFKREVERAEAAPATTMSATIEPPAQPALASSEAIAPPAPPVEGETAATVQAATVKVDPA